MAKRKTGKIKKPPRKKPAAKKKAVRPAKKATAKPVKKASLAKTPAKHPPRIPASAARPSRAGLLRRHPPARAHTARQKPANGFDSDLTRNAANFQPLTPLIMLERAASVFPAHTAVIHGRARLTYAQFYRRCRQLASALAGKGIAKGDTVAVMLTNTPSMLEAHYGVPMTGAVLNALNTRLDPAAITFMLEHGGAKILITDREFSPHHPCRTGRDETSAAGDRL